MKLQAVESVRLDKWLWAARFFKTRALAQAAISGGKVQLAGQRVKPGRSVNCGDCYQINTGHVRYEIEVLTLADKRGPASVAQTLYQETATSQQLREQLAEQQRIERQQRNNRIGERPSKKKRRHIIRFIGKD